MTFSAKVKEELVKKAPRKMHCMQAEMAALVVYGLLTASPEGAVNKTSQGLPDPKMQELQTLETTVSGLSLRNAFRSEEAGRKYFTLQRKTGTMGNNENAPADESAEEVCRRAGISISVRSGVPCFAAEGSLLARDCCKKAFLRGAFLCCGSISDPQKSIHLEFVCRWESLARMLADAAAPFVSDMKITVRKDRWLVYVKDGSQIVDLLGAMDAPVALMEMENARILKEMRSGINRQVNCEAANIKKTVSASVRQIEAIHRIDEHGGLAQLPESLRQIAQLRLENEDLSLEDLGRRMNPPLGKSGVNHRLRRICAYADSLG